MPVRARFRPAANRGGAEREGGDGRRVGTETEEAEKATRAHAGARARQEGHEDVLQAAEAAAVLIRTDSENRCIYSRHK